LHGGLNEQLEKERVLLPTSSRRSAASYELSVICHKIEEDIINGYIDINLSHRPNGEGGRRHPRIAPHQHLNPKFQRLHLNVTWYVINNMEILDACVYKNEAYDKAGTTHCLGCIPGTSDWQVVYSCPFLQDLEVVGLCRASYISRQLKIILVEE
jgi:hypothetical protein